MIAPHKLLKAKLVGQIVASMVEPEIVNMTSTEFNRWMEIALNRAFPLVDAIMNDAEI